MEWGLTVSESACALVVVVEGLVMQRPIPLALVSPAALPAASATRPTRIS